MFRKYLPIFALCVLFVLIKSVAQGQDRGKHKAFIWLARDMLSGRESNINFARVGRFDRSGTFSIEFVQPGVLGEKFLESELVLDELAVTDEQKEKLKTVSNKWNTTRQELDRDLIYKPEKYEPARTEYWRSVDQILLEHQQAALAQFQFRHFLRNTGANKFFLESLQVKKVLNFEKQDCEQIVRNRQESRSFVREKAIASRIDGVKTLLAQFDEQERAVIIEKWPYLTSKESGMTEKFRVHLQMTEDPDYFKDQKTSLGKNTRFPIFATNAGGQMEPMVFVADQRDENELLRVLVFNLLHPSLTSKEELDRITAEAAFTEEQLSQLRDENEKYQTRRKETSKVTQYFTKEFDEKMKPFEEEANDSVVRILSPKQIEYFDQFSAGRIEKKIGPVYDLLYGKLGVALKISDKDKERLKRAAKKAAENLEQATVDIESELLKRIFEPLSDEQKKLLDDLLGPPPKDIAVGLSVYEER